MLALAVLIASGFLIRQWLNNYPDSGYVLMGFGNWSLETSGAFFVVVQAIILLMGYVFFRLTGVLLRLPIRLKNRHKNIKFNRSQDALMSGLMDYAEERWQPAEKTLMKHVADSGTPLLHYLMAAKAAGSRGAIDKRDEYLRMATQKSGGHNIAVGLTQASLQLSSNQFEQALATLLELQASHSSHPSVLKMLYQVYEKMGDWVALRQLIPALQQHKILTADGVQQLEINTSKHLLKQVIKQGDTDAITDLWHSIPKHIQSIQGMSSLYYAALIEADLGTSIATDMAADIVKNWDETLLVLYASITMDDPKNQLQTAEQWLSVHSESAVLLRSLAQISIRCFQSEKARDYLTQSVAITPAAITYQMLGDVLLQQGNQEQAHETYKKGLALAVKN